MKLPPAFTTHSATHPTEAGSVESSGRSEPFERRGHPTGENTSSTTTEADRSTTNGSTGGNPSEVELHHQPEDARIWHDRFMASVASGSKRNTTMLEGLKTGASAKSNKPMTTRTFAITYRTAQSRLNIRKREPDQVDHLDGKDLVDELRAQALENSGSGDKQVPQSEAVNQLRRTRSMADTPETLRKDPTLVPPPHIFRNRGGEPPEHLPLAQRPGPETRSNTINDAEYSRASVKHGGGRYLNGHAPPAEVQMAVDRAETNLDVTREEAIALVSSTKLTGGWANPKGEKGRTERAKKEALNTIWDPKTKVDRVNMGQRGYGDPVTNPSGRLNDYVGPSGQGVRYSVLNRDHVASRQNSGQNDPSTGQGLRTMRGVTNPEPFSIKGLAAEKARQKQDYQDKIAEIENRALKKATKPPEK